VAPLREHWFGPLQRFEPSTSSSQCVEQHWLSLPQDSPVRTQEPAGTSHFPFTQLSEQQSVLWVHDWW
jgi:hypothetical protein